MLKNLSVLCFFSFCALLCAQDIIPLETVIRSETAIELRSRGVAERISYRGGVFVPLLNPATALGKKCASLVSITEPVLAVEYLALLPKKSALAAGTEIPRISGIIRSLSTLQGITYFSHSSNKRKVLYEESYTMRSADDKTRVPDLTEGSADGKVIYALQKDSSFGRVRYEYAYYQTVTETAFSMTNLDPLKLGLIKVIEPAALNNCLLISDLGDSLLVYAILTADFTAPSFMEDTVVKSFTARSDALFDWFRSMYGSGAEDSAS